MSNSSTPALKTSAFKIPGEGSSAFITTVTILVMVAGWYPEDGSDSLHSGADLLALDLAYQDLRAAYAARVRAVRQKLGLTQDEAGRIIGGGRRAFQKYESGTIPPSDAAVGLLEILERHPEEVATLKALRATPAPSTTLAAVTTRGRRRGRGTMRRYRTGSLSRVGNAGRVPARPWRC